LEEIGFLFFFASAITLVRETYLRRELEEALLEVRQSGRKKMR
jgi:hypothetical protein